MRVSLFVTCLADAIRPSVGFAALKLLQDTCRRTGMTVVIITHNQAITAMERSELVADTLG